MLVLGKLHQLGVSLAPALLRVVGIGEHRPQPVPDLVLAGAWLRLLVGFDLAYAVVCLALFRFVVEA